MVYLINQPSMITTSSSMSQPSNGYSSSPSVISSLQLNAVAARLLSTVETELGEGRLSKVEIQQGILGERYV